MGHRSSLLSRLAASSVVLAVVLAVITMVFAFANGTYVTHTIQATLHGYSKALMDRIETTSDPDLWRAMAKKHGVGLWIEKGDGTWGFDAAGHGVTDPQGFDDRATTYRLERRLEPSGRIVLRWDLLKFTFGHLPLLIAHLLLLIVVIVVVHGFQNRQLQPLASLRAGVDSVARGEFAHRVAVVRRDEIGQVADAFNQMTDRVRQMMNDRERLLADVSHELRSPLARVKVALEMLPASGAQGEKRESIARDVRDMEGLISVLLERQQVQAHAEGSPKEAFDLRGMVEEVIGLTQGRPPGVVFAAGDGPVEVEGTPTLIRSLVHNLLDNGLKFSPPDSRPVVVEIERSDVGVQLSFSDDGIGIAEDERQRIFEPFVKLDRARGHQVGYGLGLNLCQRIAQSQGLDLQLQTSAAGGIRAVVVFPNRDSSSAAVE